MVANDPTNPTQVASPGSADNSSGSGPPTTEANPMKEMHSPHSDGTTSGSQASGFEGHISLRGLLASYDDEVDEALNMALRADSGLERVRALHNSVRPAVVVHDAVLNGALCPLLEPLPGGAALADRLRHGCEERADLLARFDAITRHVAAHNVYPVSGEEVESILEGLERSFSGHVHDETARVSELLTSATATTSPERIAAVMALEARHAPTRHSWTRRSGRSAAVLALRRWQDRFNDWSDAHWNWSDVESQMTSPRFELVQALEDQASAPEPSARGVLEAFDAAVTQVTDEFRAAEGSANKELAARRTVSAIAIHDTVIGAVVCPLLEKIDGGMSVAELLHRGCTEREDLQIRWDKRPRGRGTDEARRLGSIQGQEIVESLIEAFARHKSKETVEAVRLLSALPDDAFRTWASSLNDEMWPWHSTGPALLGMRMALWAKSSPTRSHPGMVRHPSSRSLRLYYRLIDHFRDYWGESALERWITPNLPGRPFSRRTQEAG